MNTDVKTKYTDLKQSDWDKSRICLTNATKIVEGKCYIKIKTFNYNNPPLSRADNSVKHWQNLPISNPKPDRLHINARTMFGLNPLAFTQVIVRKTKIWACFGQITPSKFDEICPLAIPNQISTIPIHIPSLVNIHWCLLKLSSGNQNMDVSWADNSVKIWQNLPISNPKSDLLNINAHTQFGENPLMFTQVIIRKRKTDGRTTDGRTDCRTDGQTYERPAWNHNISPLSCGGV